jgi:hypothetical protein
MTIPTVKFGEYDLSRLIMGGNPISGFSHISSAVDKEMADYYTTENIKRAFDECQKNGINTFQGRGDRHIMRVLNEYKNEGKQIYWIAQTASELSDIKANLAQIAAQGAIGIYQHGTAVDNLWHTGKTGIQKVLDNMKLIRDTGLRTGLGTHRPEVIDYVEEHDLDVDFYATSFYNLAKQVKHVQATGAFKEEVFDDNDSFEMIKRINQTDKQCLAFKIFGAGRKTSSQQTLHDAVSYAVANIKPNDAIIVGLYQKHKNQIEETSRIFREVLSGY